MHCRDCFCKFWIHVTLSKHSGQLTQNFVNFSRKISVTVKSFLFKELASENSVRKSRTGFYADHALENIIFHTDDKSPQKLVHVDVSKHLKISCSKN